MLAYEFAVDHADYMRNTPGVFIRELNKITLHKIDDRGGTFRTGQVKISGMDYQPPEAALVPDFMGQLAAELKEGPQNRSVVQFAAEMHSKLTSIHPFVDGNGRTARLLMNAILMDAGLPPIVISHGDKQRYLECLATSNKGDISALCILFAESLDSSLEELERGSTPEEPVEEPPVPQITQWVPSQDLADIMEKCIARLPVDRKARYDAWRAGFEALREEVRSTSYGFNELYGHALYQVELTRYDTLPFEKYEGLLRRISVPKTWLMSTEISSGQRSERFVFFFRSMSLTFLKTARKNKQIKPIPPADVTLCISRGFAGMNQMLRDEPIRLREIAYNNGEWLFLLSAPDRTYTVESMAVSRATNFFLRDAIAACL